MDAGLLYALIAAGSAIVGALIPTLLAPLLKGRTRLIVETTPSEFALPNCLTDYRIERWIVKPTDDEPEAKEILLALEGLRRCSSALRLKIANPGRRAVKAVTIRLTDDLAFLVEGSKDGETIPLQTVKKLSIGDIDSNSECKFTVWPERDPFLSDIRSLFIVSASEFDKIRRHVRLQRILSRYYFLLPKKWFWAFYFVALSAGMALLLALLRAVK